MPDDTYPKWAWKDGSFIPYEDCTIHVRTQAVMVSASVFEGIKAFWNKSSKSLYLFRLEEHIQRLRESMKIMRMNAVVPRDLGLICAELLMRNDFTGDAHMMPTAYVGEGKGNVALARATNEGLFITGVSRPRSAFLDKGLRVCVSSWTRISDNSVPPRVKAAGNYQNGRLALNEAWANGFDNCILLNHTGTVAEGPGACMMMVGAKTVPARQRGHAHRCRWTKAPHLPGVFVEARYGTVWQTVASAPAKSVHTTFVHLGGER